MSAPAGLGAAGAALWASFHDALPEGWEWDPRELAVLELAARQADDLAALEAVVAEAGVSVVGSRGQVRLNAAVTEARQARQALSRLLGTVAIPQDDEGAGQTVASKRAQHAANARWSAKREKATRRGA